MSILHRLWQSVRSHGYPSTFGATPGMRKMARQGAGNRRQQMFEEMEQRILLTTLSGDTTFQFVDAQQKLASIELKGNITAEVYASDGSQLVDLVTPADIAAAAAQMPPVILKGLDIFAIYITSSDINSSLTITAGAGGDTYTGGVPSLFSTVGGTVVTAPAGAGQIFVGDHVSNGATANIPLISVGGGGPISAAAQYIANVSGGYQGGYYAGIYSDHEVGKILVDGTVTGKVAIEGSVGTFYAGWLLTGDATGQGNQIADNFYVAGDLGNLLVRTSAGTESTSVPTNGLDYDTGVQVHVAGKIGHVQLGGAFAGSITADDASIAASLAGLNFGNQEPTVYVQTPTGVLGAATAKALHLSDFGGGVLPIFTTTDPFFNGTLANATDIGALDLSSNPTGISLSGKLQGIGPNGTLGPNPVDYYGVGVMATQVISVTLYADSGQLGIFDPDGRLISSTTVTSTNGVTVVRFTADRPGTYRIAVGLSGDLELDGSPGNAPLPDDVTYGLIVNGMNNTAIGAVQAGGDILTENTGITATQGDIGTIHGANFYGGVDTSDGGTDVATPTGSLSDLDATSIGQGSGGGLLFYVPTINLAGNMGLLEGTSSLFALVTAGYNIQTISTGGDLEGQFVANKAIGVVRAGSITGNQEFQDMFSADADHKGNDGFIDLIDVTGDLGSLLFGGPRIETGTGGDLRFLHVGGDIYQDPYFGSGQTASGGGIGYGVGESVQLVDDSGAVLNIYPSATGQLTVYTYGIYGAGGVAISKIESTSSLSIIDSSTSNSFYQRADIGEIDMEGSGAPLIDTTTTFNTATVTLPGNDPVGILTNSNVLQIAGAFPLDVFTVDGAGTLNSITNSTGGDMANIDYTGDIGNINVAGSLGTATAKGGAILNQSAVIANTYPFNQQHIGVVADNLGSVKARTIANFNVTGDVASIVAGSGGITGPIEVSGDLASVNVGGGLAESGAFASFMDGDSYGNDMSNGGLYVGGTLLQVVANNADIRGDIIANSYIGVITVTNGSIIGSQIGVYSTFDDADYFAAGLVTLPEAPSTLSAPVNEIQDVQVKGGNGGILGSSIRAANIGSISVDASGFGILDTYIDVLGDGELGSLSAGGYGIRDVSFHGAQLNSLAATGSGNRVAPTNYSASVRGTSSSNIDNATGQVLSTSNNLTLFMAANDFGDADYRTGIIGNSSFVGSQKLGLVKAFTVEQNSDIGTSDFNFSNSVGSITLSGPTTNLNVVTGTLTSLSVAGNVSGLNLQVAGHVGAITIAGNFLSGLIYAKGPSSNIQSVNVTGNFAGTLESEGTIGSITVGYHGTTLAAGSGAFTGNIELHGASAATVINFNGGYAGTLSSTGAIGTINLTQGLAAGSTLATSGSVNQITVGGDYFVNKGLAGNILVTGSLGSLVGGGAWSGNLVVGQSLSAVTWNGPVTGNVRVGGNIGNFMEAGNLSGNMVADGGINYIAAYNINGSLITSGGVIGGISLPGAMSNSVVQAGITTGNDGVFGSADPNEKNYSSGIGAINVAAMNNSVISAGGAINSLVVTGRMIDSDVSSATILSGNSIRAVTTGANPVNSVSAVHTVLANAYAVNTPGTFAYLNIAGGGNGGLDANSFITAGVAAGADGTFGTADDVYNGRSAFVTVYVNRAQYPHLLKGIDRTVA